MRERETETQREEGNEQQRFISTAERVRHSQPLLLSPDIERERARDILYSERERARDIVRKRERERAELNVKSNPKTEG